MNERIAKYTILLLINPKTLNQSLNTAPKKNTQFKNATSINLKNVSKNPPLRIYTFITAFLAIRKSLLNLIFTLTGQRRNFRNLKLTLRSSFQPAKNLIKIANTGIKPPT